MNDSKSLNEQARTQGEHRPDSSGKRLELNPMRPDADPMVQEAIADAHRPSSDIWLVDCPWCGWISYWNEGSHATCRNCERDITSACAEAYTLADYWDYAPYPDEDHLPQSVGTDPPGSEADCSTPKNP